MTRRDWNRAVAAHARTLGTYDAVVKPQHWAMLDRNLDPNDAVLTLLARLGTSHGAGSPAAPARGPAVTFSRSGASLYAWQQEALEAWERAGRVGVVQAVTGTGKTRVGIEAMYGELRAGGKVLVVVPTTTLLHQWHAALRDTSALAGTAIGLMGDGNTSTFATRGVIVSTIHSAKNLRPPARGLIVADECHRYGSDTWFEALHTGFPARLGLSATYERGDDGDERLARYFGSSAVYEIAYDRAIRDDVVAHFVLAFVGVRLSPAASREYADTVSRLSKARTKLVYDFGLRGDPHADFMKDVARAAAGKWRKNPSEARTAAISYMSAFQNRARILAEAPEKTRRLVELKPVAEDARGTLIFTQTIRAAENAAALFRDVGRGAAVISSALSSEERETLLTTFRDGRRSVISAPRVLDEGVDVPDADLGIVVTASSSRRQMIQRMGRVLRRKKDGRRARMVILYAENTVEDPSLGAHEGFNDIAWDVADDARIFSSTTSQSAICDFLCQPTPTTPPPHRQDTGDQRASRPHWERTSS